MPEIVQNVIVFCMNTKLFEFVFKCSTLLE